MRLACRLDPKTSFQMAGEWLKYQLSISVDPGSMNCKMFLFLNISEVLYQIYIGNKPSEPYLEQHANSVQK